MLCYVHKWSFICHAYRYMFSVNSHTHAHSGRSCCIN